MLPTPHSSDLVWMQRALSLAHGMRGHVWPNPPVGCVIVNDGDVVAKAATHAGGRPHAERKALVKAGAKAEGSTLYVTLEPCCHWGKTPPCADAIIDAGVSRVVSTIRDPDPRVNGGGFARLKDAGVEITVGLCIDEAEWLISGFLHRVRFGQPELVITETTLEEVPAGIDAVIMSSQRGPCLFSRSGEIDISGVPADQLLTWMGKLGLTSVAVSRADPIRAKLSTTHAMLSENAVPSDYTQPSITSFGG